MRLEVSLLLFSGLSSLSDDDDDDDSSLINTHWKFSGGMSCAVIVIRFDIAPPGEGRFSRAFGDSPISRRSSVFGLTVDVVLL